MLRGAGWSTGNAPKRAACLSLPLGKVNSIRNLEASSLKDLWIIYLQTSTNCSLVWLEKKLPFTALNWDPVDCKVIWWPVDESTTTRPSRRFTQQSKLGLDSERAWRRQEVALQRPLIRCKWENTWNKENQPLSYFPRWSVKHPST